MGTPLQTCVLFAHDDDDEAAGYAEQALTLCRGLGLSARTVTWAAAPAVARDVATQSPEALLLLLSRADSLVVRGAAALRAAYDAALEEARLPKRNHASKTSRGVIVAAGLPSLGWAADTCLRLVGREHVLVADSSSKPARSGKRRLVHADGGCLLGPAAAMANCLRALQTVVTDGHAPSLPAAAYKYWASGQHDAANAGLPRIVLDTAEVVACSTLAPAEDVVPVIDEGTGTQVIRAREAVTRPCVVRAPYGGNMAAILQALRLATTCGSNQDSSDEPKTAAVKAAFMLLWRVHTVQVSIAAALLLTMLVLVALGVARWTAVPAPAPQPMPLPMLYYVMPPHM